METTPGDNGRINLPPYIVPVETSLTLPMTKKKKKEKKRKLKELKESGESSSPSPSSQEQETNADASDLSVRKAEKLPRSFWSRRKRKLEDSEHEEEERPKSFDLHPEITSRYKDQKNFSLRLPKLSWKQKDKADESDAEKSKEEDEIQQQPETKKHSRSSLKLPRLSWKQKDRNSLEATNREEQTASIDLSDESESESKTKPELRRHSKRFSLKVPKLSWKQKEKPDEMNQTKPEMSPFLMDQSMKEMKPTFTSSGPQKYNLDDEPDDLEMFNKPKETFYYDSEPRVRRVPQMPWQDAGSEESDKEPSNSPKGSGEPLDGNLEPEPVNFSKLPRQKLKNENLESSNDELTVAEDEENQINSKPFSFRNPQNSWQEKNLDPNKFKHSESNSEFESMKIPNITWQQKRNTETRKENLNLFKQPSENGFEEKEENTKYRYHSDDEVPNKEGEVKLIRKKIEPKIFGEELDMITKLEEPEEVFPGEKLAPRGRDRRSRYTGRVDTNPLKKMFGIRGNRRLKLQNKGGIENEPEKSRREELAEKGDEVEETAVGSDTESADHGSADKSSMSKLTHQKQPKKLMSGLLGSFRKGKKDRVGDNDVTRTPPSFEISVKEQTVEEPQVEVTRPEGIVYAELDMARSPGNVMRRDDEKTEYAEIIYPGSKTATERAMEELRKSRENLSSSRENLTEVDEAFTTVTTPDGKKEAAV